mmetsp:Transcript_34402/g.79530  ORF Transcript_34402/g.79530 Transcript_34402/m.79530 type:complete len:114 (+) Transcript_34402:658-999(+)
MSCKVFSRNSISSTTSGSLYPFAFNLFNSLINPSAINSFPKEYESQLEKLKSLDITVRQFLKEERDNLTNFSRGEKLNKSYSTAIIPLRWKLSLHELDLITAKLSDQTRNSIS